MRIAFGGGGSASDEHQVLERFAAWVGEGRVLYLPIALEPPHDEHLDWATATLGALGVRSIAMASSSDGIAEGLTRCDAVFIGGGNTYSLLYALRTSGADRSLRRFAESGLPVYGGSAGAISLGRDIATARHTDPNDVGIVDTSGLDLARGYAIWCHYTPNDAPLIVRYVRETATPVLALPERGGLVRADEDIRVVGPDPTELFRRETSETLQPNDPVPAIA